MSTPNNQCGGGGGSSQKPNSKQKRQRTTSQHGQPPQKYNGDSNSPYDYGNGGGGGGSSARKNKSHSNTRVYSNSSRQSSELQSLLSNLPGFDQRMSGGKQKRGGGGGSSNSNFNQFSSPSGGADGESNPVVEIANDEESNRLNSAALRRIDPSFCKLHGTASQVAVYRYNPSTQSWDKTDTAGCLFLYERNAPPKYGLVVMNRKNVNNFIHCFGPDGQVVLNTPYLLLRAVEDDPGDGGQSILCIWFYDNQECVNSSNILRHMGLKFEGDNQGFGLQDKSGAGQLTGNTLFQILQQGKKDSPQSSKGNAVAKVMTAEELESQMLHESENTACVTNGHLQGSPSTMNSTGSPSVHSPGGSVLQQLFNMSLKERQAEPKKSSIETSGSSGCDLTGISHVPRTHALGPQNQMRTVEQLERVMKKERTSESSTASASAVAIQDELRQTLGIPSMNIGNFNNYNNIQSLATTASSSQTKSVERSLLDNIVGKSVDETDPDDLRKVLQNADEASNLILVTETVPGANEARLTWRMNRSSSVRKDNDSTFTTPTGEYVSASGTRCSSQLGNEMRYFDGPSRQVDIKPSPLTRDQLMQALVYLVQSDSDFIKKIHDAYVKSLQQAYEGRQF